MEMKEWEGKATIAIEEMGRKRRLLMDAEDLSAEWRAKLTAHDGVEEFDGKIAIIICPKPPGPKPDVTTVRVVEKDDLLDLEIQTRGLEAAWDYVADDLSGKCRPVFKREDWMVIDIPRVKRIPGGGKV